MCFCVLSMMYSVLLDVDVLLLCLRVFDCICVYVVCHSMCDVVGFG